MSNNARRQSVWPAHYYHHLLQSPGDLIDRTRDELWQKLSDARFVFGGRLLSPYLRPHFVTEGHYGAITRLCEALWRAITKVADRALENPILLDYLGLTEWERRLIATDPKYRGVSRTSRLDSFLTETSYQFVELNAESPAGIAYSDVASEIFASLEVMRKFTERFRVRPLPGREKLLAVLLSAYREFQGSPPRRMPQIAIVDYSGLPTQREFELFQEYFQNQGYPTIIADPRELEFSGGRLRKGDFEIDLIYKRLLVNEFLERIDECRALLDAYEAQAVCVVNSFRGKLVHKKLLFGVLTDEQFADYFTDEERALIERHVPWTRRLEPRRTLPPRSPHAWGDDRGVDLLEFTRQNRERLVLKPNDEYGGKGIFIGWQCDASEWDDAIETSLPSAYLVQERVTTQREVFPYIQADGQVAFVEQLVDLDPLLFDGHVGSAFTRLSTSELANVTAGGGMVPVFVIRG
jgi:hypothetical protein